MAAARPLIVISDAQALGDDGAALALLFASRRFSPITLVASSGNVWADEACANLKNLVARFGLRDVAILKGLSPERNHARLDYFETTERHRGDVRFAGALRLPAPQSNRDEDDTAIENLIAAIEGAKNPEIILLAPATILSAALALRPDLSIGRVFAMGGTVGVPGNATPQAEFNVWFDAEAAEALFAANVPLTLLPLDATNGLTYSRESIMALASPQAAYIREYLEKWKGAARPLWDEALVAAVLSPALIRRTADMRLGVVTEHDADFGACRIEASANRRPVQVILELERDGINALFSELLAAPR
jgi:purine nucleosidase